MDKEKASRRFQLHGNRRVLSASQKTDSFTEQRFVAPKARVLVVDDITTNLQIVKNFLRPYCMKIDICSSGADAITLVKERHYDLIFMDHLMPDMNGLEATEKIRELQGDYFQSVPIVAFTANEVSDISEALLESGMNDFLAKPIDVTKLNNMLIKWLPFELCEKPKSKEGLREKTNNDQRTDSLIRKLAQIPSLNTEKALAASGGSSDVYMQNLKLSVKLMPENIEKINVHLDSDLHLYAIEVHGLKGVLNSIGAYSIGKMALALELLAKSGDVEACRTLHPILMSELKKFLKEVTELLESSEKKTQKHTGDITALSYGLKALESAVLNFDGKLAANIQFSLCAYTYGDKLDNQLSILTRSFERFDFGKSQTAIAAIKDLLASQYSEDSKEVE